MKYSNGFQIMSEGISPNSRTGMRHHQSIGTMGKLNKLGHTGTGTHGLSSGALTDFKGNSTPNKASTQIG